MLEVDDGYLALEWIEPGRLNAAGAERARAAASRGTHAGAARRASARSTGRRRRRATWLRLAASCPTSRRADWPSFYAERRLLPLARMARERGRAVARAACAAVERVCERIARAAPARPSRRRGCTAICGRATCWPTCDGRPWLIDPSAYGGHREVDLAMLRAVRRAVGARSSTAYEEVAPLADGWQERVGLYQLLPLLVHALLFGGSYGAAAERAARRYA